MTTRRENVTGMRYLWSPMIIRPAATVVTFRPYSSPFHSHRQFFTSPQTLSRTMSQFYNLKAKLPGDKEYDFEQLKGKVVLVVNVASKW